MDDATRWPIYSRNQPQYFILDGGVQGVGHGPRATACAFWNEFMPLLTSLQGNSNGNGNSNHNHQQQPPTPPVSSAPGVVSSLGSVASDLRLLLLLLLHATLSLSGRHLFPLDINSI